MTERKLLQILKAKSEAIMQEDKYYHDFAHVMGVYHNVEKLLRYEMGHRLVLLTAALFHDIDRDKEYHGAVAALKVEEILGNIDEFPKELIEHVSRIIRAHDSSQIRNDERLFYDADKMDAFNELADARTFMMYSKDGLTLHQACEKYSQLIDSFYNRLHTDTARWLAEKDYRRCKRRVHNLLRRY